MSKIFSINKDDQLCIGGSPVQYNYERSAKIDLCLERVHDFLKRRMRTTLRLEKFINGKDEKAKDQLLKKHELLYFKEPLSLLEAIRMFYEGIDTFLQTFSDFLAKEPGYPKNPFRLTERFYSELKKIDPCLDALSIIFLDDSELEISQRLVSHENLRALVWEIYRDGIYFIGGIEKIKKKDRKIVNAKLFDLFTGKRLEYKLEN